MADRTVFSGSSTEVPWQNTGTVPEGFGDQYARHISTLYDASALPLTSVGGTGNNVTATVDPSLPPGGLRDGMKFGITWAAANSGPMTLKVGSAAAVPVLSADGAVAAPGLAILGGRALLEYVGGAFRVLSGGAGSGGLARYYWQFTASGTWTKPAGLPDDTMVFVEAWGGGQSGGRGGTSSTGGVGGNYVSAWFRAADLPASLAVTIGAGGAARTSNGDGNNGGTTTLGALLSAPGGGVPLSGGVTDSGGAGGIGYPGKDALRAGAGGGGYASSTGSAGGVSRFGGDGGAGKYGGAAESGAAPGGGGGASNSAASGAGARGEVRIWI